MDTNKLEWAEDLERLVSAGIMTRNEARAILGLPPYNINKNSDHLQITTRTGLVYV